MSIELNERTERVRVTSSMTRGKNTLIKGVPVLPTSRMKSARYSIQVWFETESLPFEPVAGQVWKIEGDYEVRTVDVGNYLQNIHHYALPKTFDFKLPHDGETFIQFLAKDPDFKGIGESKARELWYRFGPKIHEVLQANGSKYLEELREALSDKSIKALYVVYAKYSNLKHTIWMTKAGVPASVQRRLLKYHKAGTVEAINHNPYELVHFGMTISQVDQLLKKEGCAWQGDYYQNRIQSAALEALHSCFTDGSTYVTQRKLTDKVFGILKHSQNTEAAVAWLKCNPSFALFNEPESRFHVTSTAIQELAVAKRFKLLASRSGALTPNDEAALSTVLSTIAHELTEKQLEAVRTLLINDISCLTGGAGTGKTFTCNTFLKTAVELGYEIFAVALSGRAAMRLHESVGFETKTIARFLREEPVICGTGEKKLLLIGEASMVDLPTMFKIINHISPHVKIIFTGDPNQLPPIGAGKILHDLVRSEMITNTTLNIVKRQDGATGIPQYAASIKDGVVPPRLSSGNIFFHQVTKSARYEAVIKLYSANPQVTKVISSTRKATEALNTSLQALHNGDSPRMDFVINNEERYIDFKLNDDVLFTQNHHYLGIQNGTLGKLVSTTQRVEVLGVVRSDSGETIEITEALLANMELGYAITLHKAQDSQFKRVVILLEENRITDRSWLYTAVTRAECEVHIVGTADTFRKVVEAEATAFRRKTLLKELMEYI